jgi:microcystin-dependent protein
MSDPFLGEIRVFAGVNPSPPSNWAFCNGQRLAISTNEALFTLIGTIYGGDGMSTFNLPNLNGRVVIGAGQGPGLSLYQPGATGGVEEVVLTQAQMPQHIHSIVASTDPASASQPGNTMTFATVADPAVFYDDLSLDTGADTLYSSAAIQSTGSSVPHDNYMPTIALRYIIALSGIFPSLS